MHFKTHVKAEHRGLSGQDEYGDGMVEQGWLGVGLPEVVGGLGLGMVETARSGDRDAAIAAMRSAVDELRDAGNVFYGVWGAGVLAETLLERGAEGDLAEAEDVVGWLANLPAGQGSAMCEITLLRLNALLSRTRGDEVAYCELATRYRAMAESLGYEGHIDHARAFTRTAP